MFKMEIFLEKKYVTFGTNLNLVIEYNHITIIAVYAYLFL